MKRGTLSSAPGTPTSWGLGGIFRSRIMVALGSLFNFLLLNLALLITSLPVVTLPLAVVATWTALDRWRCDGEDRVVREFLEGIPVELNRDYYASRRCPARFNCRRSGRGPLLRPRRRCRRQGLFRAWSLRSLGGAVRSWLRFPACCAPPLGTSQFGMVAVYPASTEEYPCHRATLSYRDRGRDTPRLAQPGVAPHRPTPRAVLSHETDSAVRRPQSVRNADIAISR